MEKRKERVRKNFVPAHQPAGEKLSGFGLTGAGLASLAIALFQSAQGEWSIPKRLGFSLGGLAGFSLGIFLLLRTDIQNQKRFQQELKGAEQQVS